MKNLVVCILTTACLLLISGSDINAQAFVNADPEINKVLVDNDAITAMIVTFEPGKKTKMHTHPAHFVYALTSGKLMVKYDNGKTETFELNEGENMYSVAEGPHVTENVGKSPVRFLLIELKEHPYIPSKMESK